MRNGREMLCPGEKPIPATVAEVTNKLTVQLLCAMLLHRVHMVGGSVGRPYPNLTFTRLSLLTTMFSETQRIYAYVMTLFPESPQSFSEETLELEVSEKLDRSVPGLALETSSCGPELGKPLETF